MKLLVVSDAPIITNEASMRAAYAPYVKELDMWMRHVSHTTIVCPDRSPKNMLGKAIAQQSFEQVRTGRLDFHRPSAIFKSLLSLPGLVFILFREMSRADHIHLRSPGNLCLLAGVIQVFFPKKKKTVKYAGNWDPNAVQPRAYVWQKKLFASTRWSKNLKVMAYGKWPDQSSNIKQFFTATYSENEIPERLVKSKTPPFYAMYVGTMTVNKDPEQVLEIMQSLREKGVDIELDFYGDGNLKEVIKEKVRAIGLEDKVRVHGNQPQEVVAQAYRRAHFSFLISRSEGWPKVVAEAMWNGCIAIATPVSCVSWMLNDENYATNSKDPEYRYGEMQNTIKRGIVHLSSTSTQQAVEYLIENFEIFEAMSREAQQFSHQYTTEKFEDAIKNLLHS
ncbi:MAG: glycosyltransferase [Nonlabens sp.]